MDEWTIKTPNPICRLFFKIDLLMVSAALYLTDFIDWRYIHSWLVFSTQLVNWCPHGRSNYTCVQYCCPSTFYLTSPPSQTKCTVYTDVWLWGGGVLSCAVDHILQEFYTLFVTRFRTYKIVSPPQTKWPIKTTFTDWCPKVLSSMVVSFLCLWSGCCLSTLSLPPFSKSWEKNMTKKRLLYNLFPHSLLLTFFYFC